MGGKRCRPRPRLREPKHAAGTRRYAHLSDDPVREASERIDSKIAAALDGKPAAEVVPLRGA